MAGNQIDLRDYFDSKISAVEKATAIAYQALEKATEIARQSMDKRLDSMTELWSASTNKFVIRADYEQLEKEIRSLRETGAELRGKASQSSVLLSYALSGIAIVISTITLIKLFLK